MDKYCWNSLRKGRLIGFQNDVEQAFTVFKNHMLEPEDITIKQFERIAQTSQFQFLTKCKAQQQDEEQYIQLLYQILIDNYFMTKNQAKQIFSIYALYFTYCQLQRKRRINVDMNFLQEFLSFFKKNSTKTNLQWMMIAKKLMETCLSIGIKTGLKTYLIKPNGQPARKGRYHTVAQSKKIQNKQQQGDQQKDEQKQFLNTLKTEISGLQLNLQNYCIGKQKFNVQLTNSQNKLIFSDKNLGIRLLKKYNQYEKLFGQKYSQDK